MNTSLNNGLIKLKGEQCKVLYLPEDRDQVILGVAGGGKSLEALYRAILLSLAHEEPVYLLAFNRNLIKKMNRDMDLIISHLKKTNFVKVPDALDKARAKIEIETIYTFMQGLFNEYLKSQQKLAPNQDEVKALTEKQRRELLYLLIDEARQKNEESILSKKDNRFIYDEITFIEQQYVEEKDYIDIVRTGREGQISKKNGDRKIIYDIFNKYANILRNGYIANTNTGIIKYFDYDFIYWYAYNISKCMSPKEKLKYIIIDEVQDFSPAMLLALDELGSDDSCKFVLGDLAQNIFGRNSRSWSSLGINVWGRGRKIIKFKVNYRNNASVARLALEIKDKLEDENEDEVVNPIVADESAPVKQKVYLVNNDKEKAKEKIRQLAQSNRKLKRQTVLISFGAKLFAKEFSVNVENMTPRTVKGLEYDDVIIYFSDYEIFTRELENGEQANYIKFNQLEISEEEFKRQLYVAVTRARNSVTFFGNSKQKELLTRYIDENSLSWNQLD